MKVGLDIDVLQNSMLQPVAPVNPEHFWNPTNLGRFPKTSTPNTASSKAAVWPGEVAAVHSAGLDPAIPTTNGCRY